MSALIFLTKVVLLAFYLCVVVSLWLPALAQYRSILLAITAALLAVHLVEYVVLRGKMARAGADGSGHLLPTLVFGYGHWLPLIRPLIRNGADRKAP